MPGLHTRPTLTQIYSDADAFVPAEGSVYVSATTIEQRTVASDRWREMFAAKKVRWVRVTEQRSTHFAAHLSDRNIEVGLRNARQIREFWERSGRASAYLDITGVDHHVWAPLVRFAVEMGVQLSVLYVEPADYVATASEKEGPIFELSEEPALFIEGRRSAPIPGFATFKEVADDKVCFVALLGFEGQRFTRLIEQQQPPSGKIIPIIGIPGFRPEYPYHAFLRNRLGLKEGDTWKNVRCVRANCPFSMLYTLEDIASEYPNDFLKVAPIGTKPHALGAVLFWLKRRREKEIELVYDYPIRKASGTTGRGNLLVYPVSALFDSDGNQ